MEVEREEAENNSTKLCFKLKISPKTEPITADDHHDEDRDDQQDQDQNLSLPFECQVCKQRFKSGKALGGHKRIHGNNYKSNNNKAVSTVTKTNKKRKSNDNDEDEDGEEEEDEPVCPICRKSFPSKKSVFGHMRSHPERPWRGIQPPQPAAAAAEDEDDDDGNDSPAATPTRQSAPMPSSDSPKTPEARGVDLAMSLKKQGNWSVTGKRGSGKSSSCSSSSAASSMACVPVMETSMEEAVIDLMSLKKPYARTELLLILQWMKDGKKGEKQEEEKRKEEQEEEEEEEENSAAEQYYVMQRIKNKKMNKNEVKKRRKKMKLVDLEEEADQEEEEEEECGGNGTSTSTGKVAKSGEYICSICKKSFQSYQALGGHTSSHKKKSNIKINKHLPSTSSDDENDGDDLSRSADDEGGDRSSAQEGASKNVLDFDLNELPPSDEN